ncbi:UNVERIFIED_CONTAM: hypothetical protein Sradi_7076200 [Sesamum radiatum]|uniref:Uncharacterized protein n=1 Tax=Sesamum radiatum TaxID=300843 RepID=A0AAW2J5I9_SESRA
MAVTYTRWLHLGFVREVTVSLMWSSQALFSAVGVCSEGGEFQEEDPSLSLHGSDISYALGDVTLGEPAAVVIARMG